MTAHTSTALQTKEIKEILHTVAFQLQTPFLRSTSIKEITLAAMGIKVIIG